MEKFILDSLSNIGKFDFAIVARAIIGSYILLWVLVALWVWFDAGERTRNIFYRILAVLLVLVFNLAGLILYLILRPKHTVDEIYWAELERRFLRFETAELGDCMNCGYQLMPGFNNCPECNAVIKVKCHNCELMIDKDWKFCPFCSFQMLEDVEQSEGDIDQERLNKNIKKALNKSKPKSSKDINSPKAPGVFSKIGAGFLKAVKGSKKTKAKEQKKEDSIAIDALPVEGNGDLQNNDTVSDQNINEVVENGESSENLSEELSQNIVETNEVVAENSEIEDGVSTIENVESIENSDTFEDNTANNQPTQDSNASYDQHGHSHKKKKKKKRRH